MPIIAVSGATSRCGKTSLAVTLAGCFPASTASAVKFTTIRSEQKSCARNSSCGACNIDGDFRIISDPFILQEEGTDTARLLASGAAPVFWCIARAKALGPAWQAVAEKLALRAVWIIEGSAIREVIQPDLSFFVINPAIPVSGWKSSSFRLIADSDFVCLNIASAQKQGIPSMEDVAGAVVEIRGMNDMVFEDMQQPLQMWKAIEPWQRLLPLLNAAKPRICSENE
jgi:hypothetical protein